MEFSMNPSSVKRNVATPSPFLSTMISSELAVKACTGMTTKELQQASIRQQRIIV
jgi:hypothetical protein